MEPNETPEAALARELYEELRVNVDPAALTPISFASHTYDSFHLLMPLYGESSPRVPPLPLRWSLPPSALSDSLCAAAAAADDDVTLTRSPSVLHRSLHLMERGAAGSGRAVPRVG